MLIGRRPLRHVAILGATGFAAGVAKARLTKARQTSAASDAGRAEQAHAQGPPGERRLASLDDLAALREAGVLSPEEFEAAGRKALPG